MAKCNHRGNPVQVGPYTIYAGGLAYFSADDLKGYDLIVALEPRLPKGATQIEKWMAFPWADYQPPPKGFVKFLQRTVIPALVASKKVLVYCIGSHGRTGTFMAALIAILEPGVDPVEAVRSRHCKKAVETDLQEKSVRKLAAAMAKRRNLA